MSVSAAPKLYARRPGAPTLRSAPVSSRVVTITLAALLCALPSRALAQACCSGAGAITPARLAPHEDSLAGVQTRGSLVFGSFDSHASYAGNAPGSGEVDLEQDLIGAVRVHPRAQLSLLLPIVETWRTTRSTGGEAGGGAGDVNVGGRFEVTMAGRSRTIPGVAVLVGTTIPTGRAPDAATHTLATDATGVGAFQGNVGLALEQTAGGFVFDLSEIVAMRTSRTVGTLDETLGPQFLTLLAAGYSFSNDAATALIVSYTEELEATINGARAAGSSRRTVQVSATGSYPLSDSLRLQGGVTFIPPLEPLGRNQPASVGVSLTLLRSWT